MKKQLLFATLAIMLSSFCFGQAAPTVAAPTPNLNASQVISIFSDAYTNLGGTNFNPNWGQATLTSQISVAGVNTLEYASLNYQGTNLGSTNGTVMDLTSMGFIHIDYWTSNATALSFNLVSVGSVNSAGYTLTVPTTGWASVDIPLSAFAATNFDLTKVYQFMFVGNGTIYLQNIYFWTSTIAPNQDATLSSLKVDGTSVKGFTPLVPTYYDTLAVGTTVIPTITATTTQGGASAAINYPASLPGSATVVVTAADNTTTKTYTVVFVVKAAGPSVAAPVPTVSGSQVLSIFSDAYTNLAGTNFNPNWGQATITSIVPVAGVNTLEYVNLNYQGINLGSTDGTPQDVSSMQYLHFDYYTSDGTAPLWIQLVSKSANASVPFKSTITKDTWVSVDVPLSFYSTIPLTDIYQLEFQVETVPVSNGTFYIQNIYFYTSGSTEAPTTAAPTPTVGASQVISLYSDAYTNLEGTVFNPNWNQKTIVSQVKVAGVNTLVYTGLDYQGTELASNVDVSAMSYLHLDYWTANATTLDVNLISPGPVEKPYTLAVPTTGWKSVDIPLADFTPVDLTNVFQLKFVGDGTIYIQNMYFSAIGTGVKGLKPSSGSVVVYPSPAENNLYFAGKSNVSKVEIYNVIGKQLKAYRNVAQSVNVSDLKSGVYIVRLTDINGKTVSTKFTKK